MVSFWFKLFFSHFPKANSKKVSELINYINNTVAKRNAKNSHQFLSNFFFAFKLIEDTDAKICLVVRFNNFLRYFILLLCSMKMFYVDALTFCMSSLLLLDTLGVLVPLPLPAPTMPMPTPPPPPPPLLLLLPLLWWWWWWWWCVPCAGTEIVLRK